MEIIFKCTELEDILQLLPYFQATDLQLSEYSAAFRFMWQKYCRTQFAVVEGCLVFREEYQGKTYFHYPMQLAEGDATRALDALEQYCRERNIRIHFTCIPRSRVMEFVDRYGMEMRITNHRRWRDYVYNAEDFKSYAGKKFSGQRNHVNKFKKLYPRYTFATLGEGDVAEMTAFLKKYEARQLKKGTLMAREELAATYALLPHIGRMRLFAGAIRVDGAMIALSIGEKCGENLIIHIEKALTEYEGVCPTVAQEFARCFATEEIKYINREDDSGDAGLRKSKLQYNPVALADKYDVFPRRAIDRVAHIPVIKTERLVVREITEESLDALYALEQETERNKFWGYDWREHVEGQPAPMYFLQSLRSDFEKREEMPMGIFKDGAMVGEVVLHNFGYRNDCEIGMRLLPAYEGFGYAREALLAVMNYAFFDLNLETVRAKCHKNNGRSKNTLLSVGLRPCGEDETYYRFYKTAAM